MEKAHGQNGEVVSIADMAKAEFLRLYDTYHVADAPEKRKPDMIDAIWSEIYKLVFKPAPGQKLYNNCKSRLIPYMVEDVEAVCDAYINLCRLYGGVIKFESFSEMTGIHRYTLDLWNKANKTNGYIFYLSGADVNNEFSNTYIINYTGDNIEYKGNMYEGNDKLSSIRFDVKKKLQMAAKGSNTNGLSLDTMGQTVRANNDPDIDKMYSQQVQKEVIVHELTWKDLPKLSENGAQLAITDGIKSG